MTGRCEVELVELLLKAGADPNISNNKAITPLHYAIAGYSSAEKATLLGQHINRFKNSELDSSDKYGYSLLHLLAGNRRQISLLRSLLKDGVNPNVQDDRGCTPLHIAVSSPYSAKVVKTLLKHKADPNIRNHEGQTALHLIATLPNLTRAHASALLRAGAKTNIKDTRGFYPYQIAELSWDNKSAVNKLKGKTMQQVPPPESLLLATGNCDNKKLEFINRTKGL
jgi:ankyrin repeat protein